MLEISVHNARDLCESDWYELQHISRDAFNNDLDRPANEIDTLVSWNDRERYYQSHTNPNSEVGEAFNAGQEYRYPKVAVARETGLTVGFAYSAHNVSGPNEMIRDFKRLSIVKNYLWLREVVVHPDYRGQNIALGLCKALLSDETTIPAQPVSTYIWPSEMPNLQPRLEGLGFKEKGTQNVKHLWTHEQYRPEDDGCPQGAACTHESRANEIIGLIPRCKRTRQLFKSVKYFTAHSQTTPYSNAGSALRSN